MIEPGAGQTGFGILFQAKGSVFPFAFCVAGPCAIAAMSFKVLLQKDVLGDWVSDVLVAGSDSSAYNGFNFLVGFLVVFRTSQAYNRFVVALGATHDMCHEWWEAASCVTAFCRASDQEELCVTHFLHTMVRLFSMLNAGGLQELIDNNMQEKVEGFETVDAGALDHESIESFDASKFKVEMVFQWIQQLLVLNLDTGVLNIPAPIMSRALNKLGNGLTMFHKGMQISKVPYPFPYAQTTVFLLCMHWVVTPLVMVSWCERVSGVGVFTFAQVFILWSLNRIATVIENPFGDDQNDIDMYAIQRDFNERLILLLDPQTLRVPKLAPGTLAGRRKLRELLSSENDTAHQLAGRKLRSGTKQVLWMRSLWNQRVSPTGSSSECGMASICISRPRAKPNEVGSSVVPVRGLQGQESEAVSHASLGSQMSMPWRIVHGDGAMEMARNSSPFGLISSVESTAVPIQSSAPTHGLRPTALALPKEDAMERPSRRLLGSPGGGLAGLAAVVVQAQSTG